MTSPHKLKWNEFSLLHNLHTQIDEIVKVVLLSYLYYRKSVKKVGQTLLSQQFQEFKVGKVRGGKGYKLDLTLMINVNFESRKFDLEICVCVLLTSEKVD
jgi:hypothetical protein